jgi:hypothetical protein
MFGAFVIIGSSVMLILGTLGVVGLLLALWRGLTKLECWPVALSLASVTIALTYADPTGAPAAVLKLLIEVFACEIIFRRLGRVIGTSNVRGLPAGTGPDRRVPRPPTSLSIG